MERESENYFGNWRRKLKKREQPTAISAVQTVGSSIENQTEANSNTMSTPITEETARLIIHELRAIRLLLEANLQNSGKRLKGLWLTASEIQKLTVWKSSQDLVLVRKYDLARYKMEKGGDKPTYLYDLNSVPPEYRTAYQAK